MLPPRDFYITWFGAILCHVIPLQVADNACYNFMGHGYFLEDGGEFDNILDGNLAMNAIKGTGELDPTDIM